MPYNIHCTQKGRMKGKFMKKKAKEKLDAFVASRKNRKPPEESKVCQRFGGRRVVELDLLAKELWCKPCKMPLSLLKSLKERKNGLHSKIDVKCETCLYIYEVNTNKHSPKNKFPDVNLKLAVGMLDGGMGERDINSLLSTLNIPAVGSSSLKRWERNVGPKIVELADKSCRNNILLEKNLTQDRSKVREGESRPENCNNSDMNNNSTEITDLTGSYDSAWPKRGSNSLCGHSSVVGRYSGKVLAYTTRSVVCNKCSQKVVLPHTCFKNHVGSAKSMEADMAVELILKNENLVAAKCRIRTLIGDDDSSSIAALRRLSPYTIRKWSDFNHTHKSFNSKLYELKVAPTEREYFSKNFALCIKQNQGNSVNVKLALENLIPHAFGNHSNCPSWCIRDENNIHMYKYFKDGQCLSDPNLKKNIEKALEPYVKNAEQIAPCGSSQANESFNFIVTTKYPKSKHFGGSDSHRFRVAIAVLQKNHGFEFTLTLNEDLNLSPGKHTEEYRKRKNCMKQKDVVRKSSIPTKRRRMILKQERSSKNVVASNKEGICYESGMGYLNTADLIDETILPDAVDYENCCIVIFDTETTGLKATDEIIQIAAKTKGSKDYNTEDSTFEICIKPTKEIDPKASEATGFKLIDWHLYLHEVEVEVFSARDAFMSFMYFLKKQKRPCILIAHNCFRHDSIDINIHEFIFFIHQSVQLQFFYRFDAPRLIKLAQSLKLLKELTLFVKGFADTLKIFQEILPERSSQKKSFSQPILVEEFLSRSEILIAHNALNDVIMLEKLFNIICVDRSIMIKNTLSISYLMNKKERDQKIKKVKEKLLSLKISKTMCDKIAKSGLDYDALKEAYKIGGYDALRMTLGEAVNKKPRVTTNKRIVKKISDAFTESATKFVQ